MSTSLPASLPADFGRYTLQSVLGEGGMGRVYSAVLNGPAGFRKPMAIKVLRTGRPSDLINEACISGMLRHPNIVDTFELGESSGQLFIAMELVEGVSLSALLRQRSPLSPAAVLEIGRQLCFGLSHIHSLGLVHCDIKPANVLLTRAGLVKIADFGVAIRNQDRGEGVRGSPPYMAPESISGLLIDHRTDIFSLGAVLFELTTGRRLFRSSSSQAVAMKVLDVERAIREPAFEEAIEAAMPGLSPILRQCLRRVPSARFGDCAALSEALERLSGPDVSGPTLLEIARSALPPPEGDLNAGEGPTVLIDRSEADESPSAGRHFIGRVEELAALGRLLSSGARLATLKGEGGVGKTALVREFCRGQSEQWPGGIWFCDLSATQTLGEVTRAIANAVGAGDVRSDSPASRSQLPDQIAAHGRTLVVLDNCEQVAAELQQLLEDCLKGAPKACFITTSREDLGVEGERLLSLNPLPVKDAFALFKARLPGGQAGPDIDHQPIMAWLKHADRLPLSIELVAAQWQDKPRAVDSTLPLQPLHHHEGRLRDTVAWSWSLLEPWARAALAQLSVFRGMFDLEAAEAALELSRWPEAPWIGAVVERLLRCSLLRSHGDSGLFSLYEVVREFAVPTLTADAILQVRLRLAQWYAPLGALIVEDQTDHHTTQVRKRLAADLDHVLDVTEAAIANELAELAGLCAVGALAGLCDRGPFERGITLCLSAAELPELSPVLRIEILRRAGEAEDWRGGKQHAQSILEQALHEAVRCGEQTQELLCRIAIGRLWVGTGNPSKANEHLHSSLKLARSLGEWRREGEIVHVLARISEKRGDLNGAVSHLDRTLRIAIAAGDRRVESSTRFWLGRIANLRGQITEAIAYMERAVDIFEDIGAHTAAADARLSLIHILTWCGREDEAYQNLQLVENRFACMGRRVALARLCMARVNIESFFGSNTRLREPLAQVQRLAQEEMHIHLAVHSQLISAFIECRVGRIEQAEAYLARATQLINAQVDHKAEANHLSCIGHVKWNQGRLDEAARIFESLAIVCRQTGLWEVPTLVSFSAILLEQGSVDEAEQTIRSVLPSTEPSTLWLGLLHAGLAEARARKGDAPSAREYLAKACRLAVARKDGIFLLRITMTEARVLAELGEAEAAQRKLETAAMMMQEEGVGGPSFLMRYFRAAQAVCADIGGVSGIPAR